MNSMLGAARLTAREREPKSRAWILVAARGENAATYPHPTLTGCRNPEQAQPKKATIGERAMVDHFAWAQGYRDRAAKCQLSAKNTSSTEFGECYRLLEKYYLMLANLEEDFGRREVACPHAAGFTQRGEDEIPFSQEGGQADSLASATGRGAFVA